MSILPISVSIKVHLKSLQLNVVTRVIRSSCRSVEGDYSRYIYSSKNLRATVIFSIYSCVKHPILNQNLMALPKVTECLFHLICFR